ncbi:hypothetical protein Golomagni_00596 [Golovinomyces magnicellulatus]|nr:hypothetical protein Golomagni_00596 [Golovinomyces magnicellulatus]
MIFLFKSQPSLQQLLPTPKYLKICQGQVRQASLIKRPYRPYTFTQLIVLSDGSTFTMRTTSPAPVYKSNKDSRNHPLWQPSSAALKNVEADEAGRLRAFRLRFGHGWDAEEKPEQKNDKKGNNSDNEVQSHMGNDNNDESSATESLMDLISNASMNTSATSSKTDKEKLKIEEDPGEKLVTARNSLGKGVQVKIKDLEQFRKDQKLAKSGGMSLIKTSLGLLTKEYSVRVEKSQQKSEILDWFQAATKGSNEKLSRWKLYCVQELETCPFNG